MTNPTSNYSFVMPTSTDLVTDLPADFEVFGQAVDTQMKTNADAATQKATLTTKGDIYAATGTSTPARLAVGTNDQVLTVDTSTATGLKWASVSAGPVQLATTSLAGLGTVTFSSISGSYKTLFLKMEDAYDAGNARYHQIRINGSTAANYSYTQMLSTSQTLAGDLNQTEWTVSRNSTTSATRGSFEIYFPFYTKTNSYKSFYGYAMEGFNDRSLWQVGSNLNTTVRDAAITSITVLLPANTWTAGTLTLFGVN